jgi:hypothetical protein
MLQSTSLHDGGIVDHCARARVWGKFFLVPEMLQSRGKLEVLGAGEKVLADTRVLRYICGIGYRQFLLCIALAIGATRLFTLISSEDFIRYQ